MKLHVLSDIHFEHMRSHDLDSFYRQLDQVKKDSPADVAVLAGDICSVGFTGNQWRSNMAKLCSMYTKLLYVPGNHEYYGNGFDEVTDFLDGAVKAPEFHNLINLDRMPFYELDGQRFLGGTMWFADKAYANYQKRCMSDFSIINDFEPEVYLLNEHFVNKLKTHGKAGDIVITHHTPLPESIHPQYDGSYINDFFMSDRTEDLVEETLPKAWIHGHTHNAFDYEHKVGQKTMRVYCNPHGYPGEGENLQFFKKVPIDV